MRRQRDEIRRLRGMDGQLRLQHQRVTMECGAADVQYTMERRRNQRSHPFFRFHRAVAPASPSDTPHTVASFEVEPCVESAVFSAAGASQPLSASSLSNPSWPPLVVDVFALCGGDESAPIRILLCDSGLC